MASSEEKNKRALQKINHKQGLSTLSQHLRKASVTVPLRDSFPTEEMASMHGQHRRLEFIEEQTGHQFNYLNGQKIFSDLSQMEGNIENYIGMTMLPTGVIGPLRVNGTATSGDYYVPLATSEGALVASYHRGAKATRLSGGITSICLLEGIQRSPVFRFRDAVGALNFLAFVYTQRESINAIIKEQSRYAKLDDIRANIEGNQLILVLDFHTGDAAGQNMATLCTDAICHMLIEQAPEQPQAWYVESNYSGDKKATALSFSTVRGKKVTAECVLQREILEKVLKTTPEAIADYWLTSTLGVVQSGAIGAQGHVANGLTALFLATGQDAACVAEAATGITRIQVNDEGNIYASVTLPGLSVGTVGGGTGLPTQRECLELMGCYGEGGAQRLAEIACAVALCGEISIAAAISAGQFAKAHEKLGRKSVKV